MTNTNLVLFKDDGAQDGVRRPVQSPTSDSAGWIGGGPTPPRTGRRLDVDEVLSRSLPKTAGIRDGGPRAKSLAN
jgi:hypothetical protein